MTSQRGGGAELQKLADAVELIPVAVTVTRASDGVVLLANAACERLYGWTAEEMVGRPVAELGLWEDPEGRAGLVRDLEAEGHSYGFDAALRRKSGAVAHGFGSFEPCTIDGELCLLAALHDVTVHSEAEAKLAAALVELEAATRARTDLLSRASHELRTPLNAILGFGQLLLMGELDGDQHEVVDEILRAGRLLLQLVNDILDVSRIDRGELSLTIESVDLREVIDEAVAFARDDTGGRGVRVDCTLDPIAEEWCVRADRQRLAQAVRRLVRMAVERSTVGGTVLVQATAMDDGRVLVEIVGRESRALAGPDDASLSLSATLLENMGIALVSGVGDTDTAFSFVLERMPSTDTSSPRTIATSAVPISVLYVEDNPSNVNLVERVLRYQPGIRLEVRRDGGSAIVRALESLPDVVLLDLHLPDVPGDEVLRALRADPRTATTPVIVISADASTATVERLLDIGADMYLTKPIDIPALMRALETVLGGTPKADASYRRAASASGVDTGILDPVVISGLHELEADGGAPLGGLISVFFSETAQRLADLAVAADAIDAGALTSLGHSLQGSAANFGAQRLAHVGRSITELGRAEQADGARQLVQKAVVEFHEAQLALRREFDLPDDQV